MISLKNNEGYLQKYDEYLEKLLLAQFDLCEIFEHNLTKGEAREDFIKKIIVDQYEEIRMMKGVLIEDRWQSGQCDVIFAKKDSRIRNIGTHNIVEMKDCKMVLEVKSNAKGEDLRDFNEKARIIKSLNSLNNSTEKPLCGMFCYQISLEEKTIFKRFGFNYNKHICAYEFSNRIERTYPNIDFLLSLHNCFDLDKDCYVLKQFFIRWDENNGKYLLFRDYPVSKNFFSLLTSINLR